MLLMEIALNAALFFTLPIGSFCTDQDQHSDKKVFSTFHSDVMWPYLHMRTKSVQRILIITSIDN